jgi:hypothetical protein
MTHLGAPFHNGYVEISKKNIGKDYMDFIDKIETDGLTFSGHLEDFGDVWFLGFDSAHAWNDEQPESKTFAVVKEKTIKLCEEMLRKKI